MGVLSPFGARKVDSLQAGVVASALVVARTAAMAAVMAALLPTADRMGAMLMALEVDLVLDGRPWRIVEEKIPQSDAD